MPTTKPAIAEEETWVEPIPAPADDEGELASLFDRLADDPELYAPLTAADEHFTGPPPELGRDPARPPADHPARACCARTGHDCRAHRVRRRRSR